MSHVRFDKSGRMREVEYRVCCVVDGNCTAAANHYAPNARGTCFGCGEPVCAECSSRIQWYKHGVKRVCHTCQVEHAKPDKEAMERVEMRIMTRMQRRANAPYKPPRKRRAA